MEISEELLINDEELKLLGELESNKNLETIILGIKLR